MALRFAALTVGSLATVANGASPWPCVSARSRVLLARTRRAALNFSCPSYILYLLQPVRGGRRRCHARQDELAE